MMKRFVMFLFFTITLTILTSCGDASTSLSTDKNESGTKDELDTNIVTIATGGASGPYNIIGTTLADIYSEKFGINSRTQTTGASVENANLLAQQKVEMAFMMSDVLTEAVEGFENFDNPIDNIMQIGTLFPNFVQIVTTADSGIETFTDLKGKRVAVGDQNSGVEVNARNLLEGHGITYDDIEVDYLGYAEAADGLRSGQLDAAFLTSGLPNASVLELSETLDIRLVSIEPENVEKIAQDQSYFIPIEIPEGTYGNEEPIPTAAIMNALVVRSDLSEDDVYKLTKTFFENLTNLENAHQAAKNINLEDAQKGLVAPIHPGAERYYNEQ